ncbi:hypothetical protein PFISCL1PPCAC_15620 [Pristionchus fissidentatus]|uniref:Mre11 DNA-binding domain-containing protein n=1 Tax=Pristionchus fissidentatus TaxID=1538716 RepID=A0AAV5W0W1_9BILA|nr:hypothetical protein PFISCL1PPCAC_15620 [Pristionchus fissidentatus]
MGLAVYEFSTELVKYMHSYKNRAQQRLFVLFKDADGEVRFKYNGLLRFAHPMTARITDMLELHTAFIPMSADEKMNGFRVFRDDEGERRQRIDELSDWTMCKDWIISESSRTALCLEIPPVYVKLVPGLIQELKTLRRVADPGHDRTLAEQLRVIKEKACAALISDEFLESDLERLVVSYLREDKKSRPPEYANIELQDARDLAKMRQSVVDEVVSILSSVHPKIEEDLAALCNIDDKPRRGFTFVVHNFGVKNGGKDPVHPDKRTVVSNVGGSRISIPDENSSVFDDAASVASHQSSMRAPSISSSISTRRSRVAAPSRRGKKGSRTDVLQLPPADESIIDPEEDDFLDDMSERSSVAGSGVSRAGRPHVPNKRFCGD